VKIPLKAFALSEISSGFVHSIVDKLCDY